MKVGFIQMTPVFGDREHNVHCAVRLIENNPADLIVLPEFFNTGYLFTDKSEVQELSESLGNSPTVTVLSELSRDTGTSIVAGLPERCGTSFFNSAVLVTPEGDIHLYRKTHLFDREKLYFEPGNTGFNVVSVSGVRIGMMICFDWFFPESARSLALKGAQIIAHPSNLVLPHCPKAMVTRALENKIYTITSNRSGSESRGDMSLSYIGSSRIVSPSGQILAEAGLETEIVCTVEINPIEADEKSINQRNNLFSDRRKDLYRD